MKITDNSLSAANKKLLSSFVGCELEAFISDKISSERPMSFGIVGLRIAGRAYALRADIVPGEPFGEPDDVTQLSLCEEEPGAIRPVGIGTQQIEYSVGRYIKDIAIYEDALERLVGDEIVSRYISTPAIVFELDGTELVFENQGWLDEVIDIHRGPGSKRKVRPAEDIIEDENPEEFRVSRKVITLASA